MGVQLAGPHVRPGRPYYLNPARFRKVDSYMRTRLPKLSAIIALPFCLYWALGLHAQTIGAGGEGTNGLPPYVPGSGPVARPFVATEPVPTEHQFILSSVSTNITVPDALTLESPPPTIQIDDDGARADYGRLPTRFSANINSEAGAVRLEGPGKARLAVRPTWIAYADDSGRSLLVGEIRSRVGGVAGNVVIYTNVFAGEGLRADVRYVYHANELHQDIVLYSLPTPDPNWRGAVYIQVWSEVLTMSAAQREMRQVELRAGSGAVVDDESADFGPFKLVTGRTFSLGREDEKQLPVAKTFYRDPASGRVFIVETVTYEAVRDLLAQGGARGSTTTSRRMASLDLRRNLPPRALPGSTEGRMLLASAKDLPSEGVVLDYVIVASVPLPANAISWWPAGGNANDAVGSNNGTPQGNATYAAGMVGRGFTFDGDGDYVQVPNSASLSPSSAITVETWVYWSSNATTYYGDLVSKDGEVSARQWLLNAARNGPFRPHVWTENGMLYFNGNTTAAAETWYHVAMTYDSASSNLILYVNGVEDGRISASGSILGGTEPVRIGGGSPPFTAPYYFQGKIDEPAIYARALSASEIRAIYAAGAAGKHNPNCDTAPSGIVGWWPGDDTAEDFANTNSATWVGSTGYVPANVSSGFQTTAGGFWTGGNFLEVGDRPEFNVTEAVSLEAWIYANSSPNGHRIIIGKDAEYGVRQYMMALTSANRVRVHVWNTNGTATWFDGNTTVLNNTWYHVAMTYNRTNLILYVNGAQDGSVNATHQIRTGTEPLRIGSSAPSPGGAPYTFSGIIDEAALYSRALTPSEVSALYAAGCAGKCKVDTDQDGLTDLQEARIGTNPNLADTDGDGVSDGTEVFQGRNPLIQGHVSDTGGVIHLEIYTPLK